MNHMIDADTGESCQSPRHNAADCHVCREAEYYKNATFCPMCCCYYIDGREVEAPEYFVTAAKVCDRCIELEGEA